MTRLLLSLLLSIFLSVGFCLHMAHASHSDHIEKIILAGGCFWGVQAQLDQIPGVQSTTVGYTGGTVEHPKYEVVCGGQTGHAEAVEVTYDSDKVKLRDILQRFFQLSAPVLPDIFHGGQYKSAIFYFNEEQKHIAEEALTEKEKRIGRKIFTEIAPAKTFWKAEEYHQNYYKKQGVTPSCH